MLSKKRVPIFRALPIDEASPVTGEVRLWRAFLDQCLFDTFWPNADAEECAESKKWLYDREQFYWPDFYKVCEMAEIEPHLVEYVVTKLEQGESPI